ncbi:MAG: O-antigen ligase family protein, partial [Fibrobacteria bacterium]
MEARAGKAGYLIPVATAAVLGWGLLTALSMGSKWLGLVSLAYLCLAGIAVVRDRRLVALGLISACIPLGLQYNLWSHGNKFSFMEHYGGSPPEPVIFLVDLPILLLSLFWLFDLRTGRKQLPSWTRTETLAAVFIIVSLLSLFITDEYALVLFETIRYLKYFLVYLLLRTYLDRPLAFWVVLGAQIGVLAIQGIVSALQYFLQFSIPFPVGGMAGGAVGVDIIGNEMILRVSGLLGHCNTFSAYLSLACSFCLIAMFARIKPWMRLAIVPFLVAGVLSLILTFSRNGWLAFVVNAFGVSAWAIYTRRLKLPMIVSLIVLCLVMVGVLGASGVLHTVSLRLFGTEGKEMESRWDLALVAWEMIRTNPLIGIGLNTFEEAMAQFDPNHITNVIQQP